MVGKVVGAGVGRGGLCGRRTSGGSYTAVCNKYFPISLGKENKSRVHQIFSHAKNSLEEKRFKTQAKTAN